MISVLNNVKKQLPNKKQEASLKKEIDGFVNKLEKNIKKNNLKADVFVGGSWAKGTWLHNPDVDLFLRFDKESDIKKAIKIFGTSKYETIHGSRDYYKIGNFEIVPILKIKKSSEAKNITDISPFHIDYVDKNLKSKDDVKLLKLFCKSAGVYGAESHVAGFSGYVLELLVIKYGNILKLFKAVQKWIPKVEIDFGKKGMLSEAKTKSPLIIHDPTLPGRNAAAGLDYSSFSKFVFKVKEFVRKPSKEFFIIKTITKKELALNSKKRGTKLFSKELVIKGNKGVFLSKLKKDLKRVKSKMEKLGFSIYDFGFFEKGRKAIIFFELQTWETSKKRTHFGPPVWVSKKYLEEFISKWKKIYVKDNRLATDIKRESNGIKVLKKIMKEYKL